MAQPTDPIRLQALDPPGPALDVALDFVNTSGLTNGRPFEDLVSLHDVLHWLADHGLLDAEGAAAEQRRLAGSPSMADAALADVRAVRAGLREVIDAIDEEREPAPAAVEAVNAALAMRETALLVSGPDGLRLERRREGMPLDQALAELARRVAAEVGDGRPERFSVCGNDRCRWVFYDRSRPGSRRWCEMASCGNRMKAARHRERVRAQQATRPLTRSQ